MCDIKVVNPAVLKSIESFMNDSAYREALENSINYNTRLCIERRLRMPFLDSQTGLAQNHCNLFMTQRQRMPGLREGQIYTYPSKPWRKKRRQYLMNFMTSRRKDNDSDSNDMHTISTVENPAITSNDDSKDSSSKDEVSTKVPEAWYYDEMDMHELDGFDEPDADSDMDYEEPSRRRKGKRGSKVTNRQTFAAESPSRRGGGGGGGRAYSSGLGRGRRKNMAYADLTDTDKPFSCDLCGARYKTRPGLTYHYTHSHKEGRVNTVTGDEEASQEGPPPSPANKDKSPVVPSGAVSPANLTQLSGVVASTNTASANLPPPTQAGIPAEQGPGGSTTPAASPSSVSSAKKNRQSSSTPSPVPGGLEDSGRKDSSEDQDSSDGKSNAPRDPVV